MRVPRRARDVGDAQHHGCPPTTSCKEEDDEEQGRRRRSMETVGILLLRFLSRLTRFRDWEKPLLLFNFLSFFWLLDCSKKLSTASRVRGCACAGVFGGVNTGFGAFDSCTLLYTKTILFLS